MNFCTKCSSYYQTPGTCNCFAPPKVNLQPIYEPYRYPTTTPWIVPTVWPTPNTTPPYEISGGSITTTAQPDGWYIWNATVEASEVTGAWPYTTGEQS